ncbi:MAG: hypothetical protein ACRDV4_00930 [Acidimicrobiales bacterium]
MKLVGWLLGLVGFGGLIVLAVAGLSAATAVLVTAFAIVAMIALGGLLGGRTTPNRAPYRPEGEPVPEGGEDNGGAARGGTPDVP